MENVEMYMEDQMGVMRDSDSSLETDSRDERIRQMMYYAYYEDDRLHMYDSDIASDSSDINEHSTHLEQDRLPQIIPRNLERDFDIHANDSLQEYYERNANFIMPETPHSPINANHRIHVSIIEDAGDSMSSVSTCPVCLDETIEYKSVVTPNCKHVICVECLKQHLAFCRTAIPCCVLCRTNYSRFTVGTELAKHEVTCAIARI